MKNQKGITLIALIITIIVMLILVGVTVNVALNGGLFNTANEATTKTEKETIYDQIVGAMELNNNGNVNVKGTYDAVVDIFGEDKVEPTNPTTVEEDTAEVTFTVEANRGTYTYKITGETVAIEQEDEEGEVPTLTESYLLESNYTLAVGTRTITIPEGFGVVDTIGDGEVLIDDVAKYESYITANLDNGIVVQDELQNQFVWIPVPEINDMVMCQSAETVPEGETDGTCNIELDGDILKCTKHNSEALAGRLYADTTIGLSGENFNADLTGQTYNVTSGYREPANLTGTSTLSEIDVGTTGVLPGTYKYDSQEMFTVYGGGDYSDTMYQTEFNSMAKSVALNGGFYVGRYETGGFNEAKVVSKPDRGLNEGGDINSATWYKMYKMQKEFGNDSVGSSMIWGCQYDQVMKFVDGKLDGNEKTFNVTTGDDSRHSNSATTGTGNTSADFVANIYDLEGNEFEWSLEGRDTVYRVCRGGNFSIEIPASSRVSCNINGSRLTLYVQ